MTSFDVVISNRDFSANPTRFPPMQPESLRWHCFGGPREATIAVDANDQSLFNLLRCPVEIYGPDGSLCWWGYVNEVSMQAGAWNLSLGLSEMVNNVAVAYSFVASGSQTMGTRKTTAWATDADSIAEFGTKDQLVSLSGATDAMAEQLRDKYLMEYRYPYRKLSVGGTGGTKIYCRGWWDTLGWRLTSVASSASDVATMTQIEGIITTYGQFLVDTSIETTSGVSSAQYRDGNTDALRECEALLRTGSTNDRQMLSEVTIDRLVRLFEEPAKTPLYYIDQNASLFGLSGDPVPPWHPPVGNWVELRDIFSDAVETARIVDPTLGFMEGATWTPGGLQPEWRGQATAQSLMEVLG